MPDQHERTLTDADIDALEERFVQRFYSNLGKGMWSLAWKGAVLILLALAAYGYSKGH